MTNGQYASWNLVCRHALKQREPPGRLADVLRNRIREGDVHIVIACEDGPAELADLVRAATGAARVDEAAA